MRNLPYSPALIVMGCLMTATMLTAQVPTQIEKQVSLKQGEVALHVKLKSAFSSRTAKPDDIIVFEVERPYMIDQFTVVDRGTFVKARVRAVVQPGHRGRPGRVELELLGASAVDGTLVPLRFGYSGGICCIGGDARDTPIIDPEDWGSHAPGELDMSAEAMIVDVALAPFTLTHYLLKKGGNASQRAGDQFDLWVSQDTVVLAKAIAVNVWNAELMDAVMRGKKEEVLLLLHEGADLNSLRSWYGQSVLYEAAWRNWNSLAETALSKGIDLESRPLAMCVAAANDYVGLVQLLLDNGVSINAESGEETPLMCAARGGAIQTVQFLLDHGADPSFQSKRGQTALKLAKKELKFDKKQRAYDDGSREKHEKVIALLTQAEAHQRVMRKQ